MTDTKTPEVVAVSTIHHGTGKHDEDGAPIVEIFEIGDELTDEFFTEDQLRALIASESAVDLGGVLQEVKAVPYVDQVTAKRDELLKRAGKPILVDTSNPMNRGVPDMQFATDRTLEEENARLKEELEAMKASKESSSSTPPKPAGATKKA